MTDVPSTCWKKGRIETSMKINTRGTSAAASATGWVRYIAGVAAAMLFAVPVLYSQQEPPVPATAQEVQELRQAVHDLQAKVAILESQAPKQPPAAGAAENSGGAPQPANGAPVAAVLSPDDRSVLDFFHGTSINVGIDGYYGYNFNQPVGRVNLLRAYDVSSNSFSLNQANLIIEHAADVSAGNRFGIRLDLQYGQATESSQGNPGNELRPQAYRPIWQAYGDIHFPPGQGPDCRLRQMGEFSGAGGELHQDHSKTSPAHISSICCRFITPAYVQLTNSTILPL